MKYVLFAATILLIALSSSAQAPTGIVVNNLSSSHHRLQLYGGPLMRVNCYENSKEDTTICSFDPTDEHGQVILNWRATIGVPNPQK